MLFTKVQKEMEIEFLKTKSLEEINNLFRKQHRLQKITEVKLQRAKEGLEYFVKRVEEGSIHSKRTYAKFKEILEILDGKEEA